MKKIAISLIALTSVFFILSALSRNQAEAVSSTTVTYSATSGSDSTGTGTQALTVTDLSNLTTSDDVRMTTDGNWPSSTDDSQYLELIFTPSIPNNATINSVQITNEYQRSNSSLNSIKMNVWDGVDFSHSHTLNTTSNNTDISQTIDLSSYINTPAKVNSLKVKLLMQGGNSSTKHDFVKLDVTYTPNSAPTATSQSVSTNEDNLKNITLTGSDPESQPLTFAVVTNPTHGTLSNLNSSTGSVDYTPTNNYNGSDSFTFKTNDGSLDSTSGTVSITVNSINDNPIINSVSVTPSDPNTNDTLTAIPNGSDADEDPLTFSYQWQKNGGDISGATNNTLDLSTSGNGDKDDTVTVKVTANDGHGGTSSVFTSSSVTVINSSSTAGNQSASTNEDEVATIILSGTDLDNDVLNFEIVSDPSNGSLSEINQATGEVSYTPNENYNGIDSLTFKTNDGSVDSSTATINLTINSVNDSLVLSSIGNKTVNELANLSFTANANDLDADHNPVTFSLTNAPTGATIDSNTGEFSWTPTESQGPNDYTFTINTADGGTETDQDSEQITVTVNEVNIAPTTNNSSTSTVEDIPLTISLNAADSDLPANSLTYIISEGANHGVLSELSANQTTYTPDLNFIGIDNFKFKVFDGVDYSNESTFNITVIENTAPTANDQDVSTNKNIAKLITLTGSDPEDQSLTFSLINHPLHGTLSNLNSSNQEITYTPDLDYTGLDAFSFKVNDGKFNSESGTINIETSITEDEGSGEPEVISNDGLPFGLNHNIATIDEKIKPETNPETPTNQLNTQTTPTGEVLGASISCGPYLSSFMQMGSGNDSKEVTKLQNFLNNQGFSVPVTGYYGQLTKNSVINFQIKNREYILDPWKKFGFVDVIPTGQVFKMTKWRINMIKCPELDLPAPTL